MKNKRNEQNFEKEKTYSLQIFIQLKTGEE